MKFFNKQTLAFAIVGALASGNALSADLIQTTNTIYAKEIQMPVTGLSLNVIWKVGYNFNTNETRYACIRLEGAEPTGVAPVITKADGTTAASPDLSAGTVNTNGNVAFFTLSSNPTGAIPATKDYQVQLNGLLVDIADRNTTVTATVGLYDNPAAAGQCLAAGPSNSQLIAGTGDTKSLISFQPSYTFVSDPNRAIASVENMNTPYAGFKFPVPASGVVSANANNAYLGRAAVQLLTYGTPATAPLTKAGVPITLADLFDTAAATNSVLSVAGDFGAWATAKTFATVAPTASTATSASWQIDPTAMDGKFEVVANSTSENEIPAGGYIASLKVKAKAGYTLDYNDANAGKSVTLVPSLDEDLEGALDNQIEDIAFDEASIGQIFQDGVRLQAPLTQVPTGWISRMVITNTGNKDRTFFLTVQGEDGNNITSANLTGYTVKAKTTYVIDDLNTVLTGFTAAPRATIVATVAGPEKEIKGLYQIVNPDKGSISNYVMVNQDTGSH